MLLVVLTSITGYTFFISATWDGCKPMSEVSSFEHLLSPGEFVPPDATCFDTNHMTSLSFYRYPPKDENTVAFFGLRLLLVPLAIAILLSANRTYDQYVTRSKDT
jgi:hypothetical protein